MEAAMMNEKKYVFSSGLEPKLNTRSLVDHFKESAKKQHGFMNFRVLVLVLVVTFILLFIFA